MYGTFSRSLSSLEQQRVEGKGLNNKEDPGELLRVGHLFYIRNKNYDSIL